MTKLMALAWQPGAVVEVNLPEGDHRVITRDTGDHPDGLACDGTEVYWTTMGGGEPAETPEGFDYSARNGGLHAVGLDGTRLRDVVPRGAITTGKQLALDSSGNLYWGDREGFALSTVRTDGTGLRDLVKRDGSGAQDDWIVGVAVDEARGWICWTQKGAWGAGSGRILRAGLEIPEGQSAQSRTDIEVLWDGLVAPIDLEIVGDRIFWTDRGDDEHGAALYRAELPARGRPGGEITEIAGDFDQAIGLAVDSKARLAYVSDLAGRIHVIPAADNRQALRRTLVDPGLPLTGLCLIED